MELAFVWQRHELFQRAGFALARRLGVPIVLSVHALQVREARAWGVRRPGWSRWAERGGEVPQIRAADVVACVSDEVASQVTSLGVPDRRVLVTPNGVDLHHFRPDVGADELRTELGLDGQFVVGWAGSFQGFHALGGALEAMDMLRDEYPWVTLVLIGDGLQRPALESRASTLGLHSVRFVGTVPYLELPRYLAACDAGIVLAPEAGSFHYSPVKLREYMACGLPVVAQAAGELESILRPGVDAVLVRKDDPRALADAIARLAGDGELRRRLAKASTEARKQWCWDKPVEAVLEALRQNQVSPAGEWQ